MKSKFLRSAVAVGVLAAFSGYAVQASAMPEKTFSFHQSTGFVVDAGWYNMTTTGVNGLRWFEAATGDTPPVFPFGTQTFDTIAWGYQDGSSDSGLIGTDPFLVPGGSNKVFSGLRVTGYSGFFTTGAATSPYGTSLFSSWETITKIEHHNKAINSVATDLLEAVIYSELYFDEASKDEDGNDVDGPIVAVSAAALPIAFKETFNETNPLKTCTDGNPLGSRCDDLFGFPKIGFDPFHFQLDGHKYEVEFQIANFVNSATSFPACATPNPFGSAPYTDPFGVGYDCTVWTAENTISSLEVQARIREIPEPTTLALLGLSLLGVAGLRRRTAV